MGFVGFGVTVVGLLIALVGAIGLFAPERVAERQRGRDTSMADYEDLDEGGQQFVVRLTGLLFAAGGLWLAARTPSL